MQDGSQKNPVAANLVYIPGFLLLGGGVPIKVGNEVIGAVGVGRHGATILMSSARWSRLTKSKIN